MSELLKRGAPETNEWSASSAGCSTRHVARVTSCNLLAVQCCMHQVFDSNSIFLVPAMTALLLYYKYYAQIPSIEGVTTRWAFILMASNRSVTKIMCFIQIVRIRQLWVARCWGVETQLFNKPVYFRNTSAVSLTDWLLIVDTQLGTLCNAWYVCSLFHLDKKTKKTCTCFFWAKNR